MPVKMCSRQAVGLSRRLYMRSTAALNDHLRGDSDDDDGTDEHVAQTTDQTPPQDAAAVMSEPATRASGDCCEVCLINRKDSGIALVPCGHQRFPKLNFWFISRNNAVINTD